ncbi:MAG: acyltransferase [Armatimonadota bacterium]
MSMSRISIKKQVTIVFKLATFPLFVWWCILGRPESMVSTMFELIAWMPGTIGSLLRVGLLQWIADKCDPHVRVEMGTLFSDRHVRLGHQVYIGAYCVIGRADIEDFVLLASRVSIPSGQHVHHFDRTDVPIALQGGTKTYVRIGRGSWIGEGAIVMADVGEECVIGAGAVVTKPIPAWSIAVGVPAKVVRSRKPISEEQGLS